MLKDKSLYYSFIAHAILIAFMLLKVVFYPNETYDFAHAIRVDMVGLPEKIDPMEIPTELLNDTPKGEENKTAEAVSKEEETAANALPEKEESTVDLEAINLEKAKEKEKKIKEQQEKKAQAEKEKKEKAKQAEIKKKQQEALNKLKKLSAIEKIKEDLKKEEAAQSTAESNNEETQGSAQQKVYKGQALSAGTVLTGVNKLQSESYLAQLDIRIKSHWSLPQWLIGKSLRTRIHIRFDEKGQLISKNIIQSSGQPTYDEYCVLAIEKSLPLPPVPEKFTEIYKTDGVIIGFPD